MLERKQHSGQSSVKDKIDMDSTWHNEIQYRVHLFKNSCVQTCLLMLAKLELKRMKQEGYCECDIILNYMVNHAEMTQ